MTGRSPGRSTDPAPHPARGGGQRPGGGGVTTADVGVTGLGRRCASQMILPSNRMATPPPTSRICVSEARAGVFANTELTLVAGELPETRLAGGCASRFTSWVGAFRSAAAAGDNGGEGVPDGPVAAGGRRPPAATLAIAGVEIGLRPAGILPVMAIWKSAASWRVRA